VAKSKLQQARLARSTCKHCGKEIGLWVDPWGNSREWMHAPDDGPDAYQYCHCQCDACKPDTTLGIHDPTPANCCDGEEAEPIEAVTRG
jgi:hypothetical protein